MFRKSIAVRLIFIGLLAGACFPLSADSLIVGLMSFDNLVPAATDADGVNVFTIYNFTGAFALPPDAPVITPLDFLTTAVTLNGSDVVNVGTISPGSTQALSLEFPTSQEFTSALFSATLSSLTFSANGQTYLADSNLITATLLPSAPPDLTAGVDFVLLTIEASPSEATVPEPSSYVFLFSALLALLCWRRQQRA